MDLAAVSLRGVKLALDPQGRPRILAWDVVDFAEQCEDLQSLARIPLLQKAVAQFTRRHRLRSRVVVSLRGEAAFNRTVDIPAVNDESLERLLEYEAQQQIPYPLAEVHWDRRVLAIQDDGTIRATIYALRRDLVEERVRRLGRLGLPVDRLQLRPLALHNFCVAERLLEEGTVVVDCDYGALQVLIHHQDHTWFRVLPSGGVDHVERLRATLGLEQDAAVAAAARGGASRDPRGAAIAAEVARDLAQSVVRVVAYYTAARAEVRPAKVILFQGHRTVPPLAKALESALRLPVTEPRGFREIQVHADVVSAGIQEHFAEMVCAVGLALQGLGRADVDVRLHRPDLERPVAKAGFGFLAAAVLLVLLFSWITYDRVQRRVRLGQEVESLVGSIAGAAPREEMLGRSEVAEDLDLIAALGVGAEARRGPTTVYERLLDLVDEAGPAGPRVVHFRIGSAVGGRDGEAVLVLAAEQADGPEEADRALAQLMVALAGSPEGTYPRVVGSTLEASWTAPEASVSPPASPEPGLFRRLLRLHRYVVTLGERP